MESFFFKTVVPVHASSLNADYPDSYIATDLWRMFSFVELAEIMPQREASVL